MTHEQAVSTLASERYLLEEMTEPERDTFEEHYFSCVECADDVRAGGVMRDGVRAGLMNEQIVHTVHDMTDVGRLAPEECRDRAAGTSRRRFRGRSPPRSPLSRAIRRSCRRPGRSIGQPQALAPVTLRPASRGRSRKVSLARDTAVVTLADRRELDGCWNRTGVRDPHGGRSARGRQERSGPPSLARRSCCSCRR